MSVNQHWRVALATAVGSSHVRNNLPNQDAVDSRLVSIGHGQVVAIAVADGAGSASRSDEGSQVAVAAALDTLADGINRQPVAAFSQPMAQSLARNAVRQAKLAVQRYGRQHNAPIRDLASTLIVAFASDWLITAAQVGDGAVIAFNTGNGAAITLCDSHTGEHANETTFITSRSRPHEIASVGHASGSDYDALALITDGLENLALTMPQRDAFMGFWNPMLQDLAHTDDPEAVPQRLHSFISGQRVQARTTDDVTIAIAVRNRHGSPKQEEPQ